MTGRNKSLSIRGMACFSHRKEDRICSDGILARDSHYFLYKQRPEDEVPSYAPMAFGEAQFRSLSAFSRYTLYSTSSGKKIP